MPTAFESRFRSSAANRLLERFGEQIVYKPKDARDRIITAMVTRGSWRQTSDGTLIGPSVSIEVLTDPANTTYGGIDARELDRGGDKIVIAELPGQAIDKTLSILDDPTAQDFGLLALECG